MIILTLTLLMVSFPMIKYFEVISMYKRYGGKELIL